MDHHKQVFNILKAQAFAALQDLLTCLAQMIELEMGGKSSLEHKAYVGVL